MKTILCFFIILLTTSTTIALSQQFQNIGPPGGPVEKIVIDPQNPNIVYATPRWGGGLFKSIDGGETSTVLGDTIAGILGYGVAINPINSNIIYSSGHRSYDRGITWERVKHGSGQMVHNPKNPNIMYDVYYAKQLWIISNEGDSGSLLYDFKISLGSIAISYSDTNILYVEAYVL